MPDFNELVKNLYTSKNRELTPEKLDYITKNYSGKEEDFVKNFYATVKEDLTPEKLSYIKDTYLKKKDIFQTDFTVGSETLPSGSKPSQTQVDTSVPSVLTPEYREEYKSQVAIDTQKKKDLSKQLQGAKDVYYQAQGDATLFSSYNGYQSDLIKIDNELTKNYPDEATVSRTVPGQEDFDKYKAKRDQLVSDREKISQLSNEVLLRINPKIQSKIESDLKKNGLDKFTRSVYSGTKGFKVADELEIDNYAKKLAEESGISNDGTFKKLVYDKVKSTISNEISSPGINKEFENLYVKETGLTPDQAVEKDQIKNFLEGKKIQLELSTSVDSLNKEIKEKIDNEVNTITQQYKPIIESINADYKTKIAEAEAGINQLNESYKAGVIPRPQYEAEFNNIKSQFNLLGEQYKQQSEDLSKVFLNNQNELFSKYNKRFNRQVYELQSMADQKLSAAIAKYGKEYKPSTELNSQFNLIYSKAAKNYFEKDESIKYQLDKSSLLNLVGGQTAKNLFIGFGGSLKNLSAMYDFDAGYVLGDYMENSFVSSSPEIKSAWDLLDFTKLQSSVGRMVGGMAPILGASALTASVTKSAPTALRLLTTGLSNYLIETAQIGGGIKNQVFQKTGNMADANKAAKKAMDANFFLLPLYALDGLPFLGNVTLGIKNTFARAGAKAGIEVLTETPQEYFQGIFEELAVADKPISDTFKNMSLERLENTALNVIPTSVLLGGGGTAIQGVRESISKMQGRSLAAKVDLADLTETTKKQFIYDTVLRRGDVFSKAYVSSLFNSGNINEQEMESFSKMIDDSANIMAESKKIGLNKADSKIYAALRFDYLQSKNEFDSEQDEVSKKVYKAKMDSAEKSLNTYLSGGNPDAVLLTLANNEQYIYSFETLNSIINEGGEILNQIVNGEVSIGLLSDKTNPKAKALDDKLTQLKQDAVQKQAAGQVPVLTEAATGEEALVQDVENYFTENTRSTQDSKYNPDLSGEGELALQEQEETLLQLGADRIQAHGLAKGSIGQQFKDLLNILTNGLDNRGGGQLYTAPLVMSADMRAGAGAALGTGGGTAYTDGGFIILAREGVNEIRNVNDIGGVLVNQAVADTLPELIDRLKQAFPNISIESYSNAPKAIESIQSLEQSKPKKDAVSQSISSKIPVLTEAKVGEEMEQGKPQPKIEGVTEEGVQEEVAPVIESIANLKLDENNLESVIEELEFIEDAKRKAARSSTSSKTKAKLNADIAQYEANIADKPNEVRIAKTINDNFGKIKKDLKEQGLLNVKC